MVLAGPLRHWFAFPLGFGRPAATLLSARPVDELRRIATNIGCPLAGRPKPELLAALSAHLGTPEVIAGIMVDVPEELRPTLERLATVHPVTEGEQGYLPPELRWAIEHGILVSDGWARAEMPREVAFALRGEEWRAPFEPHPPLPPLGVPAPETVAREAAAAAAAALDGVAAVVEATPVALLKAGGVGAREVGRLARVAGSPAAAGLFLELAGGAGLLAEDDSELVPTPEYDAWAAEEPAERLATLLHAWLELAGAPGAGGTPLRAGYQEPLPLRTTLLDVLADLAGALPRDGELVPRLLHWHAPLAVPPEDLERLAAGLWTEAALLGVVAHGVLTPLGRALRDGGDVAAVAGDLVVAPQRGATFQADLTAVVGGSPAVELRELLDGCAVREARGTASVWRFTPDSVRRSLDSGTAAPELLDRLRAVGSVPQALEYLVNDVARRHGRMRVRAVGCVLRGADPQLLAEVAADRRLAGLGLTVLAPTVLASTRPPADTLAALRAAGYAPAAEDADGRPLIELPPQRRAEPAFTYRRIRRRPVPMRSDEAMAAAERILATTPQAEEPTPQAHPERVTIARAAPQLAPYDADLLTDALTKGEPVHIVYINADGRRSERVVEPMEIEDGYLLRAWCQLRDDERVFSLNRIRAVSTP
ncbi:helicase-associated domain-containing protein [Virgisporangium aliadipatigenens]|uniref:helicase-associated domain-containing protein n=1 Tax=Virgisporangium aliadipatigenens TaxID=741659 RepID=UPI00194273B5|nr:helicase-associated domain-containing protein [Virgisporangium aliadipatigenens]